MRRRRQWIAALLMAGLAFAQVVTAVHACSILTLAAQSPVQADSPIGQTMPANCTEMAKQSGSNVNVCESHCVFGQQVDVPTAAPIAATAPTVVLMIRQAAPSVPAGAARSSLVARAAAPPPLLLFSRFLV